MSDRIQGMPGDGLPVRGQMRPVALEVEDLLKFQHLVVPSVHDLRGGLHVKGDSPVPAGVFQDPQEATSLHPGIDLCLGLVCVEKIVFCNDQEPRLETLMELIDQIRVSVPVGGSCGEIFGIDHSSPFDLLSLAVVEAPAGDALPLMERAGGVKG